MTNFDEFRDIQNQREDPGATTTTSCIPPIKEGYKYASDKPPTMMASITTSAATGGAKNDEYTGKGSFVPKRYTPQQLQDIPNIATLAAIATRDSLAPSLQAFVNYGAEDEESLQANRKGLERYALRPRILRNVSCVDASTTILQGRVQLAMPVCIAPFAACRAVNPVAGELAIAAAARQAGIVYTVPHWAGTSVAEIVSPQQQQQQKQFFFQIYPHKPIHENEGIHREHMASLLNYLANGLMVKKSNKINRGSGSIVAVIVTCDTVNNGNREKTYKNRQWVEDLNQELGGFPEPCALKDVTTSNGELLLPLITDLGHSSSMTWDDIRWMKHQCHQHGLALILKGIMTGEDTKLAVAAGVDAIIVSNHGGRQLDGTLGTVEVVEECAKAALGSSLEVFVDGGIRRGKDIVKCLALGAKCVFVGRPILWGLAVGGQEGVARVLDILKEEYETVLQLIGCQHTREVSRAHVCRFNSHRAGSGDVPNASYRWALATLLASVASFALGRYSSSRNN